MEWIIFFYWHSKDKYVPQHFGVYILLIESYGSDRISFGQTFQLVCSQVFVEHVCCFLAVQIRSPTQTPLPPTSPLK